MKRWALILYRKVWQVVDSEGEPEWPPMLQTDNDGNTVSVPCVFVEITDGGVAEGWIYDGAGGFEPPRGEEQDEGGEAE